MYKIKEFFTAFLHSEDQSLRDRFLHVILLVFSIFMVTQFFVALFYINVENLAVIIVCFGIISGLYIYLYKTKNYNHVRFLLFIFTTILLGFFWFTTAGILGSTPYYIVFAIFTFVAISEEKYHKYIVGSYILFYGGLALIDYMYPNYAVKYETVEGQRIDIIISVFFVSIFIALSFNYIIRKYSQQQVLAEKEVTEQKRLNEELDNFVYRTSHDLRSPIVSSLGLAGLIENADNIEDVKRYATMQRKSLEKLDAFIVDIIQYSQNNRSEVEQSPIDFEELFQEAMVECRKKQHFPPVTCDIQLDTSHVLFSDKARLKVLFDNMISNSHQFLDKSKDRHFLHILVKNVNKDWEIRFTDNGIGIEEKHIDRIFDMFYRATNTTKGSGIGLYIVKQAIVKLGGTISCEAEIGEGTSFVVKLPNQSVEKMITPIQNKTISFSNEPFMIG